MKIFSYIIAAPDDLDTLPDALDSLAAFSDRIYVVDGGNVSLIHHPRHTIPLKDSLCCAPEILGEEGSRYGRIWNGTPLILVEHPFVSYGPQRNFILEYLKNEPDKCDWLVWIDADEVCSHEMINGLQDGYLNTLPPDTEGVYTVWLNLVQDEDHCVGGHHSDWLAHPRIVKVGNHWWSGSVHEHMVINRDKLVRWPVRVVHSRALFRRRLYLQRSHPNIRKPPDALWDDSVLAPVPAGVTWTLHWPPLEFPIDIDTDARDVWDEQGNLR